MKILVLNPGSTSTKAAVYEDERELVRESIAHSREELERFGDWTEQLDFRYKLVMDFLTGAGYSPSDIDCVMSRGGSPPNVASGATAVNDRLVDALMHRALEPHPASLGPVIARRIADAAGAPAYIYDPISADELNELARLWGVKGITNYSMGHVLNTHAMGESVARELGRRFDELNLIVAHLGGGNSICLWSRGKLTDVVSSDAGAMSSERCGVMRSERMIGFVTKYGPETVESWLHGKGGFVSLLGTNDLREAEKMIAAGDEFALLCQRAMAYQLAKSVCSLMPVTSGEIDGIVFTGGGSFWKRLMDDVISRISFLNIPIFMRPGENELKALAEGALRVMRGEEQAHEYVG